MRICRREIRGGDIFTTRDGLADGISFGMSTHLWTVKDSATGATMTIGPFGDASAGDIMVPADYTGAGRTDCAYFRPSTGVWTIAPSCVIASTPVNATSLVVTKAPLGASR